MILRLVYLMRCWALLLVLNFCFTASCIKGERGDALLLRNELMTPLIEISTCITGRQEETDEHGEIIGETSCEKNFSKAHTLFSDVEKRLRAYPKITTYPITQNILEEMHAELSKLKQHIDNLPDSRDKNQFSQEWKQLAQYLSSLMNKKDVQQGATTHYRPAGQ